MEQCLLIDDDVDDQEIFKMCLNKVNPNVKFMAVSGSFIYAFLKRRLFSGLYLPGYEYA